LIVDAFNKAKAVPFAERPLPVISLLPPPVRFLTPEKLDRLKVLQAVVFDADVKGWNPYVDVLAPEPLWLPMRDHINAGQQYPHPRGALSR
jgi:hypothetical protein